VERRLDLALSLYERQSIAPPILCLGKRRAFQIFSKDDVDLNLLLISTKGSGTPHKPPVLDHEGFVVHEVLSVLYSE